MRKMKAKIALLLSVVMLSSMPVMAASYDADADAEKVVSIVAGTTNSKTAQIGIEFLSDDVYENKEIEYTISCGEVTTASAIYVDGKVETKIPVSVSKDGQVITLTTPKDIKEDSVLTLYLDVYHALDASCDAILIDIETPRDVIGSNIKIAKVIQPVKIAATNATLKPALKDQVGGQLVISETERGMIREGELTLTLSDDLVKFTGTPTIVATDGIKVSDKVKISKDGTVMTIYINKSSTKYTGEITIKDFVFTTTGATPDGEWYLDVSGSALTDAKNSHGYPSEAYGIKGFVKVATEVVKPVETITFMIDTPFYMKDKEMFPMDAAPYIAENRTMMPIRYVATALGISEKDIHFADGVIVIFNGSNIVQMKVGESTVLVNGIPSVMLDTPVAIVKGRAHIPVGQISPIFGVKAEWDPIYKTVTFKK